MFAGSSVAKFVYRTKQDQEESSAVCNYLDLVIGYNKLQ